MSTIQRTDQIPSAFHDRLNQAVGDSSYKQLGDLTDTHPETVRRYMQGAPPSASFLTNLCRNLGVSAEWLLSGQGPIKARDMRKHALKNADPNELMGAIASTLTQLIDRVDRLERFVQMVETKLNAAATIEPKPGQPSTPDTISSHNDGSADGRSGSNQATTDKPQRSTAERIAGSIAKRPPDADA